MANWKGIGLAFGKSLLATQGISIDQIIDRPPRRRRRRGSIDYAAIAGGFHDVLKRELTDDERGEVEMVVIEIARRIIEDRQPEEEKAPPPRRKRRKRTTKKKAKKRSPTKGKE